MVALGVDLPQRFRKGDAEDYSPGYTAVSLLIEGSCCDANQAMWQTLKYVVETKFPVSALPCWPEEHTEDAWEESAGALAGSEQPAGGRVTMRQASLR